jgi:nitroreductase
MEVSDAPAVGLDLAAFEHLAWSRRTNLQVDPDRAVPVELIEALCDIARSAPNHKRTWPWRFALFTGDGRAALGHAFAIALVARDVEAARVAKTRVKYLRAPAVLVVGSSSPEPARELEDGYAVAAAVQNLLLAATAAGLASYWSSPPVADAPGVLALAGFPEGTQVVGVVYLGWAIRDMDAPLRPPLVLHHVTTGPVDDGEASPGLPGPAGAAGPNPDSIVPPPA